MPLDKLCIVFIFFALQYGGILRSGIEDAYQFKMSHREIRQYDKTRSLWYRILLPYSHMKYCGAPRHMRLFQALRALNWAAIIAMLVLAYIFPPAHSITLFAYFFIGAYFVLLYIPLLCYSIYMSNWPKGPKGWNLEMSRNVQSGNTQNLKSPFVNQAACCACTHSRYFAGGSPSGLRV